MRNSLRYFFLFLTGGMLFSVKSVYCQTYLMTDGVTINTCSGIFYDDGGPNGNYFDNKVMTETFCSCNGSPIKFTFTSFATEAGWDSLIIYDGPNILSPKIGGYHGVASPGIVVSTNANNCLTFFFQSDLNTNALGWAANITCQAQTATITASGPTNICPGENVTLTANAGTSYSWSTGATTQSIVVSTAGSYYVSVTTGSCSATSNPVTITLKTPPSVSAFGTATICQGVVTPLSASGAVSYVWAPAASVSNPNISDPVAFPTVTTNYSVTGTGANGCTNTSTVTITVLPAPTVTTSGNIAFCTGGFGMLNSSGGVVYSWSPASGLSNANISNPVASPSSTTTYTVTVTDGNGCSASDFLTVTVNSLPSANAGSDVSICVGDSTILNASGGGTYLWSPSSGLNNPSSNSPVASPSASTLYIVTVTNTNGCSSEDSVFVTVNSSPAAPTISQTGNVLTSTAGVTYQWYYNSVAVSGATSQSYTVAQNGIYSVCITDANGCSACSAPYNMTTIGVAESFFSNGSINVFPNPNNGYFLLEINSSSDDEYTIEIMNAFGQIVHSEEWAEFYGMYVKQIDIREFGTGVYSLVVKNQRNIVVNKLVVY